MNFKKLTTTLLIGSLSLASFLTTVHAEGPQKSNASITFEAPTDTPPVLDPSNPTEPYEPNPEEGDPTDRTTEESGPLTLDFVSNIDFGLNSIEAGSRVYESTTLRPFIQVTDRRGTGAGWNVTAQLSEFQTEDEENSLVGAVLRFTNGDVISTSPDEVAPSPNDLVELNAGGEAAKNVVTAAENEGLGSWITRWFPTGEDTGINDNVTLEVPAGAAIVGENYATITWTLTSDPTSGEATE